MESNRDKLDKLIDKTNLHAMKVKEFSAKLVDNMNQMSKRQKITTQTIIVLLIVAVFIIMCAFDAIEVDKSPIFSKIFQLMTMVIWCLGLAFWFVAGMYQLIPTYINVVYGIITNAILCVTYVPGVLKAKGDKIIAQTEAGIKLFLALLAFFFMNLGILFMPFVYVIYYLHKKRKRK